MRLERKRGELLKFGHAFFAAAGRSCFLPWREREVHHQDSGVIGLGGSDLSRSAWREWRRAWAGPGRGFQSPRDRWRDRGSEPGAAGLMGERNGLRSSWIKALAGGEVKAGLRREMGACQADETAPRKLSTLEEEIGLNVAPLALPSGAGRPESRQ